MNSNSLTKWMEINDVCNTLGLSHDEIGCSPGDPGWKNVLMLSGKWTEGDELDEELRIENRSEMGGINDLSNGAKRRKLNIGSEYNKNGKEEEGEHSGDGEDREQNGQDGKDGNDGGKEEDYGDDRDDGDKEGEDEDDEKEDQDEEDEEDEDNEDGGEDREEDEGDQGQDGEDGREGGDEEEEDAEDGREEEEENKDDEVEVVQPPPIVLQGVHVTESFPDNWEDEDSMEELWTENETLVSDMVDREWFRGQFACTACNSIGRHHGPCTKCHEDSGSHYWEELSDEDITRYMEMCTNEFHYQMHGDNV